MIFSSRRRGEVKTMEMVNQYEPEIRSFNYHHTSTTQLYPKTNPDNFHKIYPVSVALNVPFTIFCHILTLATSTPSHPFSILQAVTHTLLPIVPISLLALSKGFKQIVRYNRSSSRIPAPLHQRRLLLIYNHW
ncbi:unnamed protein product [Lactuca virosa]|uniref:Transmembrane protein n=1 Tax=Lactuca virosa TaxID=75947 RepID=A0AAU9N3L2_9ASTR|nr:unnamed protein product [Lactuca virosa]